MRPTPPRDDRYDVIGPERGTRLQRGTSMVGFRRLALLSEVLEKVRADILRVEKPVELDVRQLADLILGVVHAPLLPHASPDLLHDLLDVHCVGSDVELGHLSLSHPVRGLVRLPFHRSPCATAHAWAHPGQTAPVRTAALASRGSTRTGAKNERIVWARERAVAQEHAATAGLG